MTKDLYFCGSIRGGYQDVDIYRQLIEHMGIYGNVLTEHIGDPEYTSKLQDTLDDAKIWQTDMAWLNEASAVIADITVPSIGVGYELGVSEKLGKPVLCLYRLPDNVPLTDPGRRTSAMVSGNKHFHTRYYHTVDEAKAYVDAFLGEVFSE